MYAVLVAVLLVALSVLSVSVGVAIAREKADRERDRLRGVEWDLWLREHEITSAASVAGCPSCALLHARAELHSAPPEP
ncbi:hypothetical protein [Pseudonocardia pini]|uniref:hypothetical protein n=1 Tax=Pseudonocardia pini TaxID=2758030 RepID=UPI0015F068E1|nr:hypothetical protein [Pseudonocardia pini]